ncbi:MAG TPA: outer membrane beta-barrel protein [Vicinamibacterales bacterium]|nr:outer membrane beta-barrel protein [Vicinamibacterales bacterium]
MKSVPLRALALVCAFSAIGVPAAAQDPEDPFETARFRFGPIRFTPAIEITSVGHDSNVFNESENPKSDTTAAFGPAVQLWMRPGRTRLAARLGGQYLYFKEFADERAWNTRNEAKWEVPLSRVTPFIEGSYVNTQERQGYEIDARARRHDDTAAGGAALHISGKSQFVLSFKRSNIKYDEDEAFRGRELAEALNRREDLTRVEFRYALTPLTTFVVGTDVGRDRFELTSIRDTDSIKVMPGLDIKPLALISGKVFVGYRQFNPLSAALPDYRGLVAAVEAAYVRGSTRYDVKVDHDVAYSYEALRPYYALLDTGLTVTQRVTDTWELVGRGSRQTLEYKQLEPLADTAGATDRGYIFGAGLGYRVGEVLRLGADANYYTRRTEVDGRRDYEGLRIFGSIKYGIRQ